MDPQDPPSSRFVKLRNAFFSGALILAPLIVTVWAFIAIVDFVGGAFKPLFFFVLPDSLASRPSLTAVWEILATLVVIALVTGLGYLSRYVFGKYFLGATESLMRRIPGLGAIYNTVKQVVDTFSSQNRHHFNKAVLVEFPRKGAWCLGFLTSRVQGEAQTKTGEEAWTVFVPTSPIPTNGFLILVPKRDIVELEMTTGEGMKMIISGGAVVPQWPAVPGARGLTKNPFPVSIEGDQKKIILEK